jgi:broad specificity phosphatase PhoE
MPVPILSIEDLLRALPGRSASSASSALVGVGHDAIYSQIGVQHPPANQHRPYVSSPTTPPLHPPPDPILRERGASNLSMLPEGEAQIHTIGRQIAKQLRLRPDVKVHLYTSAFDRTKKTAAILADELRAYDPKVEVIPELAPQSLGSLEGQQSSTVRSTVDRLRTITTNTKPNGVSPLTGQPGESTDHYRRRVLPVIEKLLTTTTAPGANLIGIVCDHSSGMNLVRAWLSAGTKPTFTLDTRYLRSAQSDAPRVDGVVWRNGKFVYRTAALPIVEQMNLVLVRHGMTEFQTDHKG